jgi:hypothetical protein
MHPVGEGHRDQIQRLVQQAGGGGGIDELDPPADAEQEVISQSFEWTIAGKVVAVNLSNEPIRYCRSFRGIWKIVCEKLSLKRNS